MANLVITSTTNSVNVVFNDYAPIIETTKQTWAKRVIQNFRQLPTGCIVIYMLAEKEWCVTFNGVDNTFQIDSIDGVTPTDNNHLFQLLEALIA